MNDKPKKATHEQLLNGEVYTTSILNEPVVDFVVEEQSALAIARRRWHMTQEEEAHER